jgi:type III pantothenate kinase
VYYGHAGAIRRLIEEVSREAFGNEPRTVIGTGGFARLFESEKLFDDIVPELVLIGLKRAEELNREP